MIALLALVGATASPEANGQTDRMTELYEEVCLKAFPSDKAVERAMRTHQATEYTHDQVKVTFGDDPGGAWELKDKSATVWLEFPPYHACSVRWNAAEIGDFGPYRLIAAMYEAKRGGFAPMEETNLDREGIHLHRRAEEVLEW